MKLPIYVYGKEELRETTVEVTPGDPTLDKLIDDMFETMYDADGVGLAAPQVGKSLRLFVIDADPLKDVFPETEGFKRAFLNPTILEQSEEEVMMEEGCLSFPGLSERVTRPKSVRIKYQDQKGEWHDETLDGFCARVFQHEYDHIEGVLFTDKVTGLRKQMIKTKLQKLAKGKVQAAYRIITSR